MSVSASFTVYQEFDHLLEEQSPIESYIEWLDTMVDRCVVKVGRAGQKGQPRLLPMAACLCGHLTSTESQSELVNTSQHPWSPGVARGRPRPNPGRWRGSDRLLSLLFLTRPSRCVFPCDWSDFTNEFILLKPKKI